MAVPIVFGSINVNALDTNSSVTIGENSMSNWSSHSKNNFGNGMLFGLAWTTAQLNYIIDNDLVDTPIMDPDASATAQNQQL